MSGEQFIAAEVAQPPVARSCRVPGVSRSSDSAGRRRQESARARADARLSERLPAIPRRTDPVLDALMS